MSSLTDALYQHLVSDLDHLLDDYQIALAGAGGSLWPDATLQQAQAFTQLSALLKKFNDKERPSEAAEKAALEKFLHSDDLCASFKLEPATTRQEIIVGTVKKYLDDFWHREGSPLASTFDELHERGRLGKGMNLLAKGDDLYSKLFDSKLSATSETLLYVWEKLCVRDPRWADANQVRQAAYGAALVPGNKLSFVNKNVTVARSICTEPTVNMWFQLGLGAILEDRLRSFFGIDLSNQQEINGALARRGSRDGSLATIDLESASDSVSLELCQEILPKGLQIFLRLIRSPYVTLPDGGVRELRMLSSMGNGCTFPIQTIIFSAVVASVYACRGIKLRRYGPASGRNFGVFGDDIIVVTEAAEEVISTLQLFGFRVNAAKTFVSGPFRESCGQDWFNGSWCRGIYIKRLRHKQDAYAAINGLNRWSAFTGISLSSLVGFLLNWCHDIQWVPPDENDDAGVHVPLDKARGVHHLPHGIVSYVMRRPIADVLRVLEDGSIACDKGRRERRCNPSGLLLCFLHGSIRGYRISLRQRRVRYITKRRVTPMWDSLPPRLSANTDWWRWSDAVRMNLAFYSAD